MKTLIIDAIIGVGFVGSFTFSTEAEKAQLAEFTGYKSHGEAWRWRRDKLEELDLPALKTLYEGLRAERELQAERDVAEQAAERSSLVTPLHQGVH